MDSFFEFLGYVAGRFVALYKRIQRSIVNTFFPRRIPPRTTNPTLTRRSTSPSRKKFQILDQTTPPPPLRFTKVRSTTKFTNITETRPQKCPLCLTSSEMEPSNITKSDGQWFCKKCTNKW